MRTLYIDCGMGAAGDMLSAALLELHPDPDAFVKKMNQAGIPGVEIIKEPAVKCGITGTHMRVLVNGVEEGAVEHHHHHDHDHHGHHHADEIFSEMGVMTAHKYTKEQIEEALKGLDNFAECGQVLRSKGIVEGVDGTWIHFDYVPGEPEVREGTAEATGMICVIGVDLEEDRIRELFLLD